MNTCDTFSQCISESPLQLSSSDLGSELRRAFNLGGFQQAPMNSLEDLATCKSVRVLKHVVSFISWHSLIYNL